MTQTRIPISGTAFHLEGNGYTADIASIGATLRTLRHDGRDLIRPFEADELRPNFRGAVLAPWPNRVVDGTYAWNGEELQLALTEPSRGHALHGLAAWLDFAVIEQAPDRLSLRAVVQPQDGYPFRIEVVVDYTLGADGLHTTVTGTNVGTDAAPWGTSAHPYLVAGPGLVDEWTFSLDAATVQTVTPDRLIPTGLSPVGDVGLDFRGERLIADTFVDHAFTDLARDADGMAGARLTADGRGVEMRWNSACEWVQVHTADLPENPAGSRRGLAVEPMTCAPDALNSGQGVISLAPEESSSASWQIRSI
ncbi:aldose 1-epimerase family protein [Marisediminicola senii]|uniref:aldose 1-epimerase family protein n=1 Tax=Marisediminicola senii TaxID=2711233 RepID=UPI0013ED44A9|nr:aldose 1-epimerase family protein [Marisediminicola senii]